MRRSRKIALSIALLIGGGFGLYQLLYPTFTYRYRITLEAKVDGVVHSGSSVIEVRLKKQPQFLLEVPAVRTEVTGEAVFVGLGKNRNVVVLLAAEAGKAIDFPKFVVPAHFNLSYDNGDLPKYRRLRGEWMLNADTLPTSQLPTLITFTDIKDAQTATIIHAYEFPKVFGVDVQPPTIKIEMTDDPVTAGIENNFPWWNGPFSWLKPIGNEAFVDTRTDGFKWQKIMLKRET